MFSLLFKKIDKSKKQVKIKLVCDQYNHKETLINLGKSDLTSMYAYITCPTCLQSFQIPMVTIDSKKFVHSSYHSITIESGQLKPSGI